MSSSPRSPSLRGGRGLFLRLPRSKRNCSGSHRSLSPSGSSASITAYTGESKKRLPRGSTEPPLTEVPQSATWRPSSRISPCPASPSRRCCLSTRHWPWPWSCCCSRAPPSAAWFRLSPDGSYGRAREIAMAGARAQLAVLSLVIVWAVRHTAALLGFLFLMFVVATRTAGRRITTNRTWWWAAVPLAAPVAPVMAGLVLAGLLPVPGIAIVSVAGILIGGALTATVLAGRRALDELSQRHGEVEACPALGFLDRDARLEIARPAASDALLPALDQTRAVGLRHTARRVRRDAVGRRLSGAGRRRPVLRAHSTAGGRDAPPGSDGRTRGPQPTPPPTRRAEAAIKALAGATEVASGAVREPFRPAADTARTASRASSARPHQATGHHPKGRPHSSRCGSGLSAVRAPESRRRSAWGPPPP